MSAAVQPFEAEVMRLSMAYRRPVGHGR
jgi:hypothetical protein